MRQMMRSHGSNLALNTSAKAFSHSVSEHSSSSRPLEKPFSSSYNGHSSGIFSKSHANDASQQAYVVNPYIPSFINKPANLTNIDSLLGYKPPITTSLGYSPKKVDIEKPEVKPENNQSSNGNPPFSAPSS